MSESKSLLAELKRESANSRTMLQRLNSESYNWKPHEKSYTLLALAQHIANLPVWVQYIVKQDEYDILNPIANADGITSVPALIEFFDKRIEEADAILNSVTDEQLNLPWTFRRGEHIVSTMPKKIALRFIVLNHIVHHRGQLSVYLRLLDIPVPGMYGPSADER